MEAVGSGWAWPVAELDEAVPTLVRLWCVLAIRRTAEDTNALDPYSSQHSSQSQVLCTYGVMYGDPTP